MDLRENRRGEPNLSVFNELGEQISVLENRDEQAGSYVQTTKLVILK